MKKAFLSFFIFGAILSASPVSVSFSSADPTLTVPGENGAEAGPYTLKVNGNSVLAMCMDDFRGVSGTWNANVTLVNSANLSNTVLGNGSTNVYGYTISNSQMYQMEAYLFQQILKPGADRSNLQLAAWSLMDSTTLNNVINSNNQTVECDLTAAYNNSSSINAANYEILSDIGGKNQEFMVASPEPASFALFGAGLVAAGAARFFRRKIAA